MHRSTMPQYYSDAARLLFTLTQLCLTINPGTDARDVIHRLAVLIEKYIQGQMTISHAGAAAWIVDDLQRRGQVTFQSGDRSRIIAVVGTIVANLQTASAR